MKTNLLFLCVILCVKSYSQDLKWNGNASDNNFFNESNWEYVSNGSAPVAGTIDSTISINLALVIENENQKISASGIISLGTGSLTLSNSEVSSTIITGGKIIINENGYLNLEDSRIKKSREFFFAKFSTLKLKLLFFNNCCQ